jgi:hypothetical protein
LARPDRSAKRVFALEESAIPDTDDRVIFPAAEGPK